MYNVIVAGSTDFTADCILQLIECDNVNLSALIAPIDVKKDRKGNIVKSPTSVIAVEKNIKLLKPENINDDDFYKTLSELSPDFLIVVAYGRILSKRTLSIPKIMPLNVHGSLLPVLRGASPVEHALLYGFKNTGTTLQKMDYKLDEGDVVLQDEFEINEDWQFNELYDRIKKSGVYLLKEFFKDVDKRINDLKKQDSKKATYCGKIKKENAKLDFGKDALILHNMTKAFNKWPTAFCFYGNALIKVFKSDYREIKDEDEDFGKIIKVDKEGIFIRALNGVYIIKELQREGKKRQTVKEFLCGNKLRVGEFFK